jgi:CheY-like chemotaxis protein
MALKPKNYVLIEATNGEDALNMVFNEKPNLIILDIQIPKIDGYEVARRVKASQDEAVKKIPILALTAYAMVGDKEKILAAGCDAYISKPVDIQELQTKVDEFLNA